MPFDNTKLVSFLLPYYNGARYVEDAIRSVYSQTWKDIELIVVDDASPSERDAAYIEELRDRFKFSLIRHVENKGCSEALITAFQACRGEFISVIAQDDVLMPDKTAYMLPLLEKEGLDVLFCNGATFEDGLPHEEVAFDPAEVLEALATNGQQAVAELISSKDTVGCLLTQGALYRRKVWEESICFKKKFLLDDWPFTIKCWRDYKTGFDEHVVYKYRLHPGNVHKDSWRWLPARLQVIHEVVEEGKRVEVLARMLAYTGLPMLENRPEDCVRLMVAAYTLGEHLPEAKGWQFFIRQHRQHLPPESQKRIRALLSLSCCLFFELKRKLRKYPLLLRVWRMLRPVKES